MLVDAALFAASGWAPSPASLLAMRLVAGVATPQALAISWISSVSPPDLLPRRMGLVAACIHLGILSGTIAAGFVNWEVACVMSAVLPVLNLLLLITWHGRSDASTGLDKPALTSKSRSAALASGIKTIHFASVASTMFANGFEMSIHFALLVVVLTKDYGLTRAQYSLSLAPASFVQIFNHYYLLPRLIQVAPAYDLLTSLSACLVIILLAALLLNVAIPSSPWPFLVVQNVALWAMSFTQGVGNFASATHAASIAPEAKAALIGLVRYWEPVVCKNQCVRRDARPLISALLSDQPSSSLPIWPSMFAWPLRCSSFCIYLALSHPISQRRPRNGKLDRVAVNGKQILSPKTQTTTKVGSAG